MSIYSGFATRNQQHFYDTLLHNLISTLLVRILKFYKGQPIDQDIFKKILKEQERVLKKMEKRKYLEPKFAQLLAGFRKSHIEQDRPRQRRLVEDNNLNRTLSLLGKQMGDLRDKVDRQSSLDDASEYELTQLRDSRPVRERADHSKLGKIQQIGKIVERRKKKKKQQTKASIKSNIDIWDVRHEKPPQLPSLIPPSLTPHHTLQPHLGTRTRFNNFSQKTNKLRQNKEEEEQIDEKLVLGRQPKFRAKVYFK